MNNYLQIVSKFISELTKLQISNAVDVLANKEYCASQCYLGNKLCEFRVAKITPKKQGGFVALWKKSILVDSFRTNIPYSSSDFNVCIIYIEDMVNSGFFIFTNLILLDQKILSSEANKGGKLGFRIYPSWVSLDSKIAQKTQYWQQKYFISFADSQEENIIKLKSILNQEIL